MVFQHFNLFPHLTALANVMIGPVHVRGDVARVHARYSCEVGTHIWVSAKQSAAREIDPAVAAEGDVMPQKSTYFYPKALTGLVINPHEW